MSAPPAFVLERVSKRYDPRSPPAVDDVSAEVRAGTFLAVTGPSGSGKSTLLNLVAGIDMPTSGRVLVGGRDLAGLSENARSDLRLQTMGFVFQSFHLMPTFTVEENVAWPLEFLGVRWREAVKRAAAALDRVGIDAGSRRRTPAELSGGQQQRVAIARALATEPKLLLADEPTGNLDSRGGQAILDLLRDLNAREGLTIVLVTHNTLAATYGTRLLELADGRVARDLEAPRDPPGRVVPIRS